MQVEQINPYTFIERNHNYLNTKSKKVNQSIIDIGTQCDP
jgi:hypothetical protein